MTTPNRTVTVRVMNKKEFERAMDRLPEAIRENVNMEIDDAALAVHALAVQSILSGAKTGRVYMKGKLANIKHISSAPGQAPASDTGFLASNIRVVSTKAQNPNEPATVASKAVYSKALEFGRKRGSPMAPRPFMRPAFDTVVPAALKRIREAIRNGLRGQP
jgi:hypothetical protein